MQKRTFNAGTHFVSPTDFLLEADTTLGNVTLVLPSISTYNDLKRRIGSVNQTINYRFQNKVGSGSVTIQANPLDKVNNGVAVIVTGAGAGGTIVLTSDNTWSLDAGSSSSGGGITSPNKVYQALLSQSGTGLNSVTDNIQNASDSNYLGLPNIVWTRLSNGRFNGFKLGAFPDGKVQIYTGNNVPNSYTVAFDKPSGDADNVIITSSYISTGLNRIMRINSDGTKDDLFLQLSGFNNSVNAVAVQTDGKIIAGGTFTSYDGTPVGAIVRLNTDGTIDGTFNVGGAGFSGTVSAIKIQPSDGKIVVGGNFTAYNGTPQSNIVRLNTNGTLDTFTQGTGFTGGAVNALAIQTDGKVIVGGVFSVYNAVSQSRIARLNTNGTLDSFTQGTGFIGQVNAIVIQADGMVVVGGSFPAYNGTPQSNIARLDTTGVLDATYTQGTGITGGLVLALAIQTDQKVIAGGQFTAYNSVSQNRIIRLNTNGTLDSFTQGVGFSNTVNCLSIQADGKIIVGGGFTGYNGVFLNSLARLDVNGVLDSPNNLGNIPFATSLGGANILSTSIQTDGKIVVGGNFQKVFSDTLSDDILNNTPITIIVKP